MLLSELAPRQQEVVRYLADGYTNAEIAKLMGISEQTVKNTLKLLNDRTGSNNRFRLVLHFYKIIPS